MSLVQCPTSPTPGSSDAGNLLDGMPEGVAAAGEDRIGALPDDALRLVLSFLPSRESVSTSVLARRWRNLWKSVPTVIVYEEEDAWFVTSLLLLRDRVPLHGFVFIAFLDGPPEHVEMWIRYAASRHVRVFRLGVHRYDFDERLCLPSMTLVCQQLTTLLMSGLKLEEQTLDFSCCPVLEELEMQDCEINAEKVLCQSLRRLSVDMCSFALGVRTCISCPSLVALDLDGNMGLTPFLESMPSLVRAFVRFDAEWSEREDPYDHCLEGGYYGACDGESCLGCHHIDNEGNDCVLLGGLRGATDLKLISTPKRVRLHMLSRLAYVYPSIRAWTTYLCAFKIICTRDFKWRHVFSKLKTLYLNEWCLAADFSRLVYFLRHSPILEKLTLGLHLSEQNSLNIEDDSYKPSKQFLISKNLKVVKIKCYNKVGCIQHIVEILVSLGVPPPELITNQHNQQ